MAGVIERVEAVARRIERKCLEMRDLNLDAFRTFRDDLQLRIIDVGQIQEDKLALFRLDT